MEIAFLIIGILGLIIGLLGATPGIRIVARGIGGLIPALGRVINDLAPRLIAPAFVLAVAGFVLAAYAVVALATGNGENGLVVPTPTSMPSPSPTSVVATPTPGIFATATPVPPTLPPPSTPTHRPVVPSVTITTPRDGDSVSLGLRVEGDASGVAAGRVPDTPPPWIYVVLRPIPGDPNQSWWVQPYPLIEASGSWDAFIFVGIESDQPGTPFDICAIVSSERLSVGRYGGLLPPAITRDCISVTR